MSSEAITRNDLTAILNEVLPPTSSEYKKLLWTNPSPSSAFGTQTISVDADEYDSIEVEYNGTSAPLIMSVRNSTYYVMTPAYGGTPSYRGAKLPTTNGVYFDECHKNSGATIENSYLVPLHIYGIKYERVAPPQVDASDYVIDQGTDGIWTYRKWNSGIAECWGTHSANATVSTAWGYTYYGSVNMPNFPSIFIATPSRQATLSTPGGYAWLVPNSSNLSSTSPGGMYIFSGSNIGSVSCTISVYAIGRWK